MELRITCAKTSKKLQEFKELQSIKTNTSAVKHLLELFFEQEKIIQDLNLQNKVKKYKLKSRGLE